MGSFTRPTSSKFVNTPPKTPQAIDRNVSGSGLGLTISKKIMRQLSGELVLFNSYKPTEFQILLPKKLMEIPR